jgi:hypothetical protein
VARAGRGLFPRHRLYPWIFPAGSWPTLISQ